MCVEVSDGNSVDTVTNLVAAAVQVIFFFFKFFKINPIINRISGNGPDPLFREANAPEVSDAFPR